jgi:3-deoxy-D-manno-octulosonic-acid transferase
MRFGLFPSNINEELKKIKDEKIVWFHAASVGESSSLLPIIERFRNSFPEYKIVISTMTNDGREIIRKHVKEPYISFLLPFDIHFIIGKIVKKIKPKLLIDTETEIWPNFIRLVKKYNGKILLINGRISTRSYKLYSLVKFFLKHVFSLIDVFSMVSESDAKRIVALGAPHTRIRISGYSKFDVIPSKISIDKQFENFIGNRKIIVAGSTRENEENIILQAFKKVLEKEKNALLIIAPRHISRVNAVAEIIEKEGFSYIKRSEIDSYGKDVEVILVDTMGELPSIYKFAECAFVGGSLVNVGGHNVLEPAFWAKPVLFGPYTDNFKECVEELKRTGGGIEVKDENDLAYWFLELISNNEKSKEIGFAARKVVMLGRGCAEKNLELIKDLLSSQK